MTGIRGSGSPSRKPLKGRFAARLSRHPVAPLSCGRGCTTTRLRLRVAPGASVPGVVGRHGDAWKVRVAAAPERGKANDAVLDLLAETLDVPRRNVTLVSGDRLAGQDRRADRHRAGRDRATARHGRRTGDPDRMSIDTAHFRLELEEARDRLQEHDRAPRHRHRLAHRGGRRADVRRATTTTSPTRRRRRTSASSTRGSKRTRASSCTRSRRRSPGSSPATYGTCEVCGKEIPVERLEAVPWATLCIDDARRLGR